MSSSFRELQLRAGWRALAEARFDLRPAEGDALARLMGAAGRIVTFEALANYDQHSNQTGSREGVKKRIERVRAKLADVGCPGVVELVADSPIKPALGYMISRPDAARVQAALVFACGCDPEGA